MAIRARTLLRVSLFVTLLLVGIGVVALAAIQTSWFKDWLRGYVSAEARRFLNGELVIGRLDGNLLSGLQLENVSIRQNGETIVSVKSLGIDYSIVDLVSTGLILDDVRITEPHILLRRTAEGWNVSRLIKEEASEADREGPGQPVRVGSIGISNGSITVDDRTGNASAATRLPHQISRIDFKGSFSYQPVDFTIAVDHLSLRTDDPALAVNSLSGRIATRGDDVHVEEMALRTAGSSLQLSGVVRDYLKTPIVQVGVSSDRITLREIAAFVPALAGIDLHPAFEVKLDGPLSALKATANVRSEAGAVTTDIVTDLASERLVLRGSARVDGVRLERVMASLPASEVTGNLTFDVAGADATTLAGTVALEMAPSHVAGYRAEAVKASARLNGSQAEVEATLRAYGAAAEASGVVKIPRASNETLTANLRGDVRGLDLARLPRALGAPALRTNVNGTYRVEHGGARTDATLVFAPSSGAGATIAGGTTVEARLVGSSFDAKASGRLEHLQPARIGRALNQPALLDARLADVDVTSAVFAVTAAGRLDDVRAVDARIDVPEARALGGTLRNVVVEAHLDGARANGSLVGRVDGVDAGLALQRTDMAGAVSGSIEATGAVHDWRKPVMESAAGTAVLQLDPSQIGAVSLERVAVQASLAAGVVDVQRLEVRSNVGDADATGRVALNEQAPSALSYKVAVKDLAAGAQLAGVQDVAGAVSVEGRVIGTRADASTTGTLSATNLRYGTTAEAVSTSATYDVSVPNLDVERIAAHVKGNVSLVKAAGTEIESIALDARYAARALDFSTTVRQVDRRIEGSGRVELPATGVNLRLDALSVAANDVAWQLAAPTRIEYADPTVTVAPMALRSGDQEVTVSGTVALGRGAQGGRPAGDPSTASVAAETPLLVRAANIDLASVDALAGLNRGLGGRLDASLTLSGTMAAPIAHGTIAVRGGAVDTFKFERFTTEVAATAQSTRVDARLDQQAGSWLEARATLPSVATLQGDQRGAAPIDARVTTSTIDLGVAQTLTTAVTHVTGTLQADAHVTGTLQAPNVQGQVRVQNGAFTVASTNTPFKGLDAHVALNGSQVDVQTFRLLDPGGKALTITGGLTLGKGGAAATSANLQLTADDFEILNSRLGVVELDANLRLQGELARQIRVDGDLSLHQARLEVDRLLEQFGAPAYSTKIDPEADALVPRIGAAPAAAPTQPVQTEAAQTAVPAPGAQQASALAAPDTAAPAASSLLDTVVADVRLKVPNNLILRGDNLRIGSGGLGLGNVNITVGGDVQVTKAAAARPVVVGSIRTVRGFYEFQGRRFELQRDGTISFKGPDPTDPALDITALREISGVDAIVRVRGSAQRPELELSSRPPLEEADVLSLIIFNRPINELGDGERTALAQRAGAMLGGALAGPVAEALRDALDLDLLEISPVNDDGSPSVTVGNQVGERVFIKVRQQFGAASTSALLLEYELNELLRLQTNVTEGDAGRSNASATERGGVDLIFVVRY